VSAAITAVYRAEEYANAHMTIPTVVYSVGGGMCQCASRLLWMHGESGRRIRRDAGCVAEGLAVVDRSAAMPTAAASRSCDPSRSGDSLWVYSPLSREL
jgi:hypothetical protein